VPEILLMPVLSYFCHWF